MHPLHNTTFITGNRETVTSHLSPVTGSFTKIFRISSSEKVVQTFRHLKFSFLHLLNLTPDYKSYSIKSA